MEEKKELYKLKAKKEYELNSLTRTNTNFVPCVITLEDEVVKFRYDLEGLANISSIKSRNLLDKLDLLISISKLYKLTEDYEFNLDPNNLFYDYNLEIKVKDRDVVNITDIIEEDKFIASYKSLIGYVLQEKYTYEDYFQGGLDLLGNNKGTAKYLECNDVVSIVELLKKEYEIELKDFYTNKITIDRKKNKKRKIVLTATSILSVIAVVYGCYGSFITIPFKENIISANNSFLEQDYESVIDKLTKIKTDKLPKESKYILAYSVISSGDLSDNDKNNKLSAISVDGDENLLNFWINLGQNKYDGAIDISKKLGNNDLLVYALTKQKQYLTNNYDISGAEKESKIEKIDNDIKKINEEKIDNDTKKVPEEKKVKGESNINGGKK